MAESSLVAAFSEPPNGNAKILLLDKILARLSEDDREATEKALQSPEWTDAKIAEILSNDGYSISTGAVRNWRVSKRVAHKVSKVLL